MTNMKNILRYASVAAVLAGGQLRRADERRLTLVERRRGQSSDHGRAALQRRSSCPSRRRTRACCPTTRRTSSDFVADYLQHGNGSIFDLARRPAPTLAAAIGYFGERLAVARRAALAHPGRHASRSRTAMRASRSAISAMSRRSTPCGDWSTNLANTASNQIIAEFRLRHAAQHRRPGRRSARSDRSRAPMTRATRRAARPCSTITRRAR